MIQPAKWQQYRGRCSSCPEDYNSTLESPIGEIAEHRELGPREVELPLA